MTSPPPLPKSDAEHLTFLKGLSALMVRFALDWAESHPGTGFARALVDRTFFVNLGAWHRGEIYDNPDLGDRASDWERFLEQAGSLAGRPDAEAAILALLPSDEEYFAPRVPRDQADLHDPVRGLAARPGCLWTFAVPGSLGLPEDPSAPPVLEFHIANHRYPGSFLRDPGAVRDEVRSMARRARDLGFAGIGTRSWLNDVPAWQACFPPVWVERLTPRDPEAVGGHLGCWGQVVTARQTLSGHADRHVREHRGFEFAMRASWLSVDEALG